MIQAVYHNKSLFLAIVSLLLAIDGVSSSSVCGKNRYYDGTIDMCDDCSNVCKPLDCERERFADYCRKNCPEFFEKICPKQVLTEVKSPRQEALQQGPQISQQASPSVPSTTQLMHMNQLITSPLLWLSISCLVVAIMVTSVMVALFVFCRKSSLSQDAPLLGSNDTSPSYSRSTSKESDDSSLCQTLYPTEKKSTLLLALNDDKGQVPDAQCSHSVMLLRVV